jgi:predicted PurR-regulated permease PerM
MNDKITLKQVNRYLLLTFLVTVILYFGKPVLVPVCFAIFFAMLFTPMSNRMEKAGMRRGVSATISVLVIIVAVAGIGMLVYMQGRKLAEQFPEIEKKSQAFMHKTQDFISLKLNVPENRQDEMINKQLKSAFESSGKMFKDFVSGFVGWVGMAVIVLIFTFLFLFQREKYEAFFVQVSGGDTHPDEARKLIGRIATVAQSYLTGRVLSILIFTVLFTAGFLIVGLESAFLLAFIAALLTIIPYVGSIIGGLFPFAVALVTEDSTNAAIGALAVVIIIQGIDNYFIEPYIIGGEVNISAFFTILILLVGGLLWGVAGMILFLPMLGVAKIIFDAVPSLKAYGYLVGDQEQEKASGRIWKKLKRLFGKEKGGNGDSHPKNGNGRSQA